MNSPQYKPPSPKLCRLSVVECQSFLKIFVLMSGVELERDESFGGRGDDQTRTYKNKFRSLNKPEKIEHKTWNLSKSYGLNIYKMQAYTGTANLVSVSNSKRVSVKRVKQYKGRVERGKERAETGDPKSL